MVSVQGVSAQESMSRGGSLSTMGVSVQGVSVQGVSVQGVSVQGVSVQGVSVQVSLSNGINILRAHTYLSLFVHPQVGDA